MNVREMARAMGRRGGEARARRLSAERRKEIAALGARARNTSRSAERRILETLRYAEAVIELQGQPPLRRLKRFTGRLPGLYPSSGTA